MKEHNKQTKCFLVREESIQRLPKFVFAAAEACRQMGGDVQARRAVLSRALAANCSECNFALSGEELLALAGISDGNEQSTLLKRLRAGRCAREGCTSSHYRLMFYNTPGISWSTLLTESRPREPAESPSVPVQAPARRRQLPLMKLARVGAVLAFCLLAWGWWQWRSGGRIPYLREPEHFRVTPGPDASRQ